VELHHRKVVQVERVETVAKVHNSRRQVIPEVQVAADILQGVVMLLHPGRQTVDNLFC
jgi:hypothetical protein